MQITLEIPDDISPASLLSEADWLREIAMALAAPAGASPCFNKN